MSENGLVGTVAIVGFPNVGKSTLVNRLTGTRAAVVHETPGVTRDRKEIVCEWNGKRFLLIDTGGVDIADATPMTRAIGEQARTAVAEADLVLFVVDAKTGITPGDEEIAQILRESRKPTLVLANKIDDPAQDVLAYDLHRLGLGDPVPVSGLHGYGTGDLLDEVLDRLPGTGRPQTSEDAIRVAILGRPNVGKSSLLNAIQPELGLRVREVSEVNQKGRHTTTTAELLKLDFGGWVVDTPGLRQFSLWDLLPEEVERFFPEFRPFVPLCAFPDCTHTHEERCAVKRAIYRRQVSASRYTSYLGMFSGEAMS